MTLTTKLAADLLRGLDHANSGGSDLEAGNAVVEQATFGIDTNVAHDWAETLDDSEVEELGKAMRAAQAKVLREWLAVRMAVALGA